MFRLNSLLRFLSSTPRLSTVIHPGLNRLRRVILHILSLPKAIVARPSGTFPKEESVDHSKALVAFIIPTGLVPADHWTTRAKALLKP